MNLKQQKFLKKKYKKAIPIELLVNILKNINTCSNEMKLQEKNINTTKECKIKNFKQWSEYVKNMLTSSTIIYSVVRKAFRKRKGFE